MSVLDEHAIRRAAGHAVPRVVVHAVTGSTNDDARALLAEGCPSGTLVVADAQRAGRGRGGHVWQSPPGENVYLSVALRAGGPIPSLPPFALVVGLVVAEALEACGIAARIKWPNDVWIAEEKIAGVLVEALHRSSSPPALVVGVGLNVNQRAFPPDLRATSVARVTGTVADRSTLAGTLGASIVAAFAAFERDGFGRFVEAVVARDVLRGRGLVVDDVRGVGHGIAPSGALLVRDAHGRVVEVTSGHVAVDYG